MTSLSKALAAASLIAATPALAMEHGNFEPSSFSQLSKTFDAADFNDDNSLSRSEYHALRGGTLNSAWIQNFRGDMGAQMVKEVDQSFSTLDTDRNGMLSQAEFTTGVHAQLQTERASAAYQNAWADPHLYWTPDYFTVTYYLAANQIDAEKFRGDSVTNLKGERIGQIEEIIQTNDENRYYAVVDLEGDVLLTPTNRPNDRVGIPLDDILYFDDEHALMLSTRGEDYMRTLENPAVDDSNFHVVDQVVL